MPAFPAALNLISTHNRPESGYQAENRNIIMENDE